MANEDERLLGGRRFYHGRLGNVFWPVKLRTCLWCLLCALLIAVSVLIVYDILRTFKRKGSNDDMDHDFLKLGLPSNMSDLQAANAQLCRKMSNRTKSPDGPSNIYIIKGETNLTNEQACGIESILRLFPDKTIYLIDFNMRENKSYEKCCANQNYLGLLLYLYKDRLQLLPANRANYFKHTPLQNYPKTDEDFIFLVMVLTSYKYGGIVTSTNVLVKCRDLLECLPEETIVDQDVIVTSKTCDDFLYYLMQSFTMCKRDNSSLDGFLNGTVKLYNQNHSGKVGVRRLFSTEICSSSKTSCMFLRLQQCEDSSKWLGDLSGFCKQVTQAFLGIKVNLMEVEEETSRMKTKIKQGSKCGKTDND